MRKLDKPSASAETVFLECITAITDAETAERLQSVTGHITAASMEYEIRASNAQLHTFPQAPTIGGIVTIEEMKALYKKGMSATRGVARHIYNAIINAPRNNKCPLCGQGTVSTLDHHLPQSKYAHVIVLPLNLVPSCADCNKAKLSSFPISEEEQTIHPYFDDFGEDCWLHAEVIESSPTALRFYVEAPVHWTPQKQARAEYHFKIFKLAKPYASNAGNELINMRKRLVDLYNIGGIIALKEHLKEQADTCQNAYLNSWQTATYKALSNSDWFCSGGFTHIPI